MAVFWGTDRADSIVGGGGDDLIHGGYGNDTLDGGMGTDTLSYQDFLGAAYGVFVNLYAGEAYVSGEWSHIAKLSRIENVIGGSGRDDLSGDNGANRLDGNDDDDDLSGYGGNDTLYGGGGTDDLDGGDGDDFLAGGAGDDFFLDGGDGNDMLLGGEGDDDLDGGFDDDTLLGGEGNDYLEGYAGLDVLDGGSGNDTLCGDAFTAVFRGNFAEYSITSGGHGTLVVKDSVAGRDGTDEIDLYDDDALTFAFADITRAASEFQSDIDGTPGNDKLSNPGFGYSLIRGFEGNDTLSGGSGNDSLYGGAGDDSLTAGDGNNVIDGGAGNDEIDGDGDDDDTVIGGSGDDTLYGGAGYDVAVFTGNFSDYTIAYLGHDFYDGETYVVVDTTPDRDGADRIFDFQLFQFADGTRDASQLRPRVDGTSGNDYRGGTLGSDFVYGFAGNDTLVGLGGDDVLEGGSGNDALFGDAGEDSATFTGNYDEYVVSYDVDRKVFKIIDTVEGRDGVDTADGVESFRFADGTKTAADAAHIHFGTSGNDTLPGTSHNEIFFADGGNDSVQGAEGDDLLYGGYGDDTLDGGSGNDTLNGEYESDVLLGGDGNDVLNGRSGEDDLLIGGAGDDLLRWGRAVFTGNLADYVVTYNSPTSTFLIVDSVSGRDGTDHAIGDSFQFADGTRRSSELHVAVDGTAGNDTLHGPGIDLINGFGGNDLLDAGGGADTVCGGAGNDTLDGGEGADTALFAGSFADYAISLNLASGAYTVIDKTAGRDDQDTLTRIEFFQFSDVTKSALDAANVTLTYGTTGNDTLSGGSGVDVFYGNTGDDSFQAAGGNDTLFGEAGNDALAGGAGDDLLDGGVGTDTAVFTGVMADYTVVYNIGTATYFFTDTQDGRDGADRAVGFEYFQFADGKRNTSGLRPTINGTSFADTISGTNGHDLIYGLDGNDLFPGGDGDDTLVGGAGRDTLNGGNGIDTAVFSGTFAEYTISLAANGGAYTVADQLGSNRDGTERVFWDIEFVRFADGTMAISQLLPLNGTAGNDLLTGTAGPEAINGLAGNDTLNGGAGDDMLSGGAGNDVLSGGDGIDTANYTGTAISVKVSLGTTSGQVTGGAGTDTLTSIENLVGGDGSDSLTGSAAANRIEGGLGNDTITGGLGADTLIGGDGNDTYFVDNLADVATELASQGIDTVNSTVTQSLGDNIENVTLTGSLIANATGNASANILTGNAAANQLAGNAGDDQLIGGAGNDLLQGGEGNDILNGGVGVDQMQGGNGDDAYFVDNLLDQVTENSGEGLDTVNAIVNCVLGANVENLVLGGKAVIGTGNALNNRITGNAATNNLNGAAGADTLDGGLGADSLTGGTDADAFRFSTALSSKAIDKILDFKAVDDTIELENGVFMTLGEGALSASAFQASATSVAGGAGIRIIFNTSTGALLYDADGAGGVNAVQFATIVLMGAVGPVTAADFVVT